MLTNPGILSFSVPSLSNFAFDPVQCTVVPRDGTKMFDLARLVDQYFGSHHACSSYTLSLGQRADWMVFFRYDCFRILFAWYIMRQFLGAYG